MTLDDFVDLAATYDVDAVEPTSYYFPDPATPQVLPLVAPARLPEGPGDIRDGGAQHLYASTRTATR